MFDIPTKQSQIFLKQFYFILLFKCLFSIIYYIHLL